MAKEPNGHRLIVSCLQCEASFRTFPSKLKKGQGKFCSVSCAREHRSEKVKTKNTRYCLYCKDMFIADTRNINAGGGVYCSNKCNAKQQSIDRAGNRPYNMTSETRERISIARKGQPSARRGQPAPWQKGEKHHNWKGGVSDENTKQRKMFRQSYQKQIFERDNYRCTSCNSNKNLQVDHIKRWSDYPELRFDTDNCRTLCDKCHYQVTFGRPMPSGVKAWGQNLKKQLQKVG